MALARYANVPISNVDNDAVSFLSDLFFARSLSEKEMILWYSSTERPDLGGHEDEDNFFALQDLVDPKVNYPGMYRTVCIEYQLDNLPLNAILQSVHINESEGADGYAGLSNADMATIDQRMAGKDGREVDINSPSYLSFKTLKDMVRQWAKEYHAFSNPFGGLMVKNFYRWFSNPNSRLFEPALYAYVHGLMKKSLMLLLAEFKRLGSKVVYASFEKIVILTSKTSFANAQVYNDFILKAIKSKDIFLWIDLQPKNYWDELIWMDSLK
jgi:DNA polymerase epsilon subunit 1